MKKLSVIIPIYNTPKLLLEHCIESVQINVCKIGDEVEVLLINDGSTEQHIDPLLKETEASDSHFHYIYKQKSGVSDTRNLGIDKAQGEYIIFVDADDYLEPDAFSYMLESMKKHQADLVVFGYCINENSHVAEERIEKWISGSSRLEVLHSLIADSLGLWYEKGVNLNSPWAKIYKRDTIIRNQIRFSPKLVLHQDSIFNLWFVSSVESFYIDNRIVYHYVVHENSAVHKFSNRLFSVAINLIPMLEKHVADNYPDNKDFYDAIGKRAYFYVRLIKEDYFTHPQNPKSFWELKSEMDAFLSNPIISKWLKKMKLRGAEDTLDFKNRLLLKMHLYWIFLITQRRKKKKLGVTN
jgi:glycosyltransferase involved in cell wall biosynthesis